MTDRSEAVQREALVEIAADIVSAYVSNNPVQRGDLPQLIEMVHSSVMLASGISQAEQPTPVVPVKRSVKKDHIICLECGRKFKSLKRHIGANHDMTPEQYREKWKLPRNYPMVARDYSAARSEIAFTTRLGRRPKSMKKSTRRKAR